MLGMDLSDPSHLGHHVRHVMLHFGPSSVHNKPQDAPGSNDCYDRYGRYGVLLLLVL